MSALSSPALTAYGESGRHAYQPGKARFDPFRRRRWPEPQVVLISIEAAIEDRTHRRMTNIPTDLMACGNVVRPRHHCAARGDSIRGFVVIALCGFLLLGCVGPKSSVIPLSADTIEITTTASLACGTAGARNAAFTRAAIETINRGFDRFVIFPGTAGFQYFREKLPAGSRGADVSQI